MIDHAVHATHARRDLHAGVRYAVVRLAELLAPETPFPLSACSYCEPPAAVAAFASAAGDYLANPGVRFGTVLTASQLLSDALEQERNLRAWYAGDLTRLLLFLGQLRKVPAVRTVGGRQSKVPYHQRTTWVRQKLEALAAGSLARFQAALDDPDAGYRRRLLDATRDRLASAPDSERAWAELDHDLCYAAALLLGEGRDGPERARAVAGAALATDPAGAADAVRAALDGARGPYEVAVVLSGAGSVDLPGGCVAVDDAEVTAADAGWSAPAPAAARRALAAFAADAAPAGAATALLVRVRAWDPAAARTRALLAAAVVRDGLVAEHPEGRFAVLPDALVLDVRSGRARRSGDRAPAVRAGRLAAGTPAPELLPFLRANALARAEAAPALRVLHTWVALESLGRTPPAADREDVREAQAFSARLEAYLPPHLAAVAALAGLRDVLLTSWAQVRELARRSPAAAGWVELEAWLGVDRGRPRSLTRLVRLLTALDGPVPPAPPALEPDASPAAAAGLLLALASDAGPFAERRVATLGRQLARGSRLAKAAEAIQVRGLLAIARLKLARHAAVHGGQAPAEDSAALALAGLRLLDATVAVLRRWTRPGRPVALALADARRWHEAHLAAWRGAADPALDADRLLHPDRDQGFPEAAHRGPASDKVDARR